MITFKLSFFLVLAFLTISQSARTQIIWHLTHSDVAKSTDGVMNDSTYLFTSVSCAGNVCIASAMVRDESTYHSRIFFYRSIDGGLSWYQQAPGLIYPEYLTNRGITKVQQIDSLNAVAVGDSSVILRTFDGGLTWQRQYLPDRHMMEDPHFTGKIMDVHFSDSLTGILAIADTMNNILITFDGGRHWNVAQFGGSYLWQCHSYGNNTYRLFQYGHGPIYITHDGFLTVESKKQVFDSISDPKYQYVLANCTFGESDTILSYGGYWPKDVNTTSEGLIMRSVDGGNHWEHPFTYPIKEISGIQFTSPINYDTIYAGGQSNNFFLVSTDRGTSWNADTILCDTNYQTYNCFGLSMTRDGRPVGIFSFDPIAPQSILTKGEFPLSHVEVIERIIYLTHIYPNPLSGLMNIESIDKSGAPIRITDIFGRDVMHGVLSDQGKLMLDFSRLPKGVYDVLLNHYGSTFSVGKVVLIGK